MLTASCQTLPTGGQTSPSAAIKAVPCVNLPVMAYHAPTDAQSLQKWLSGALPDPQNVYDTPSSVASIRRTNAAINSICH